MARGTEALPSPPGGGARTLYERDGEQLIVIDGGKSAPHRRGFTAAARTIDLGSKKERARLARRQERWQEQAWVYFDDVGEVKYGARFHGNCLSKIRIFPAVRLRPEDKPIPLDELIEDPDRAGDVQLPSNLAQISAAANDAMRRVAEGSVGGLPELLWQYGVNNFVAGECSLLGYTTGEEDDPERWLVASTNELVANSRGEPALKQDPEWKDEDLIVLPEDAIAVRIWNQHPRYKERADSSIRGVLEVIETLWFLTQEVKGTAMARLNAGVFMLPNGMFAATPTPEGEQPDEDVSAEHPLITDMIEHFETPIADPGSSSVAVPYFMRASREDIAAAKWLTPERPHDSQAAKDREEMIRRYAQGVDLPPEVVTGMADVNHWTSWVISADLFNTHIEPEVIPFCWAFGRDVLVPLVRDIYQVELGNFPLTAWYDPVDLVAKPDQSALAKDAATLQMIGGVGYRAMTGIPEEYAPDADDPVVDASPDESGNGEEPAEVEEGPPAMAAAAGLPLARLGAQLGMIDAALLARLSTEADAAMRRAIERAGARLRQRAKGRTASGSHADAVRNASNAEVAYVLGPSLVAALDTDPEQLVADAFEGLGQRFEQWVARAQTQARLAIESALEYDDEDALITAMAQEQDEHRSAAWLWLSASLSALAAARLFDPHPSAPPAGEFDSSVTVPPGMIRQALVVAGGDTAPAPSANPVTSGIQAAVSGQPAGGVATGTTVDRLLIQAQVTRAGYRWVYGDPSSRTTPFEPHLDLDGVQFQEWDDPQLVNVSAWPEDPFYFPGDHLWCQCTFVPVLERGEQEE